MFRVKTIVPIIGVVALTLTAGASDRLLKQLAPRPGVAVYDYAKVISASDERTLESMIDELEQKTGAEIAVVTLQSLEGGQIDDFTSHLFEKWGVGQKGRDNGLMFLCAMRERKMRIEVGYGLEGAIPDSKAGRIRRDVITPYFKSGTPGRGIVAGVAALAQEVAKESGVELSGAVSQYRYRDTPSSHRSSGGRRSPVLPFIMMVLFGLFALRHPHLALLLLLSGGRGGGYRSGGGFGGGGGFSGGGFGGGMSGGGGSSGGW